MLERRTFLKGSAVVGALALTPGLAHAASALGTSWEKHFEGTSLYWELDCWRAFMTHNCTVNDTAVLNLAATFRDLQKNVERASPAQSGVLTKEWIEELRRCDLATRHPLFVRWAVAEAEGLTDWQILTTRMRELAGTCDDGFFALRYAWALWTEATFSAGSWKDALNAFKHARTVCPASDLPFVDACIAEIRNSAL